jgi:3-deoxy-7-phosphoheptulonate synthase
MRTESDPAAPLPTPSALRALLPASAAAQATIAAARAQVRDCLHGRDPRLLAIVGPCSVHDPAAALEFAERLHKVARETADALLVVMRVFLEKPRTALGWTGLLKDPDLDGSGDAARGLEIGRRLLLEINALGLPCAAELLDPLATPFQSDLLAWAAVGARTAESQVHRELASGLPLPVGIKNPIDGRIAAALNAVRTARAPQLALALDDGGRLARVRTPGNPDAHLVLRGSERAPNCDPASLDAAERASADLGLARPLLVDCSHDNSRRDPARQPENLEALVREFVGGRRALLGCMLESFLVGGRQQRAPGRALAHGVSITDACLGWDDTERALFDAARAIRRMGPAR